jgi:hypothetical protein
VKNFKREIEGVVESIYKWCESYDEAHIYLENYLHKQKQDKVTASGEVALAAFKKKIHVLGYEDLTQQKHEAARKLPKGIYVDNIRSEMRF